MSAIDLLFGTGVLVTGVEPDPDEEGLTRVYVGARYEWNYVLVAEPDATRIRQAFGSCHHLTIPKPEGYYHDAEAKAAARREADHG